MLVFYGDANHVLIFETSDCYDLAFCLFSGGLIITTKIPAPNGISMAHIVSFLIGIDLLIINSYLVSK